MSPAGRAITAHLEWRFGTCHVGRNQRLTRGLRDRGSSEDPREGEDHTRSPRQEDRDLGGRMASRSRRCRLSIYSRTRGLLIRPATTRVGRWSC